MAVRDDVVRMVDELSDDALERVKRYMEELRETTPEQRPGSDETSDIVETIRSPGGYEIVLIRPSVFLRLRDIMPDVGGDALADSEALYDEAL